MYKKNFSGFAGPPYLEGLLMGGYYTTVGTSFFYPGSFTNQMTFIKRNVLSNFLLHENILRILGVFYGRSGGEKFRMKILAILSVISLIFCQRTQTSLVYKVQNIGYDDERIFHKIIVYLLPQFSC